MTREQLMTYVAAILTTALETEPSPFPETMAYMALGCDMGKWQTVKEGILLAGLATIESGPTIVLTEKGREIARQCNQVLADSRK